jgi:transcriptional regulator with PAS, ATPase and Fis domain
VGVSLGEVIELGDASILLQRRSVPLRPRRLWPHGYFEGRLDDECTRGQRDGARFAVAVFHCLRATAVTEIQDALAEVLRPVDVAGEYGAGEYEVLLIDTTPDEARRRSREIAAHLGTCGVAVNVGLACYPRDGRSPDELIAKACADGRGESVEQPTDLGSMIVNNAAMKQLHRLIDRVAGGTISVLLLGESGVGKEILAEQLHRRSPRRDKPFLRLNCAALTETLLESELFGHEKGAFTGAAAAKPGLLESADGGTVFLDEIGELPMPVQVKLLRVLEERKVLRVGALKPRDIDVRFVAATNRDIEAEVAAGTFRHDLYYRLAGISLIIPPLRDRGDEIEPLTELFLHTTCRNSVPVPPRMSAEALEILTDYSWPGNIRELRNVIERAVLLSVDEGEILPEHLPLEKMRATFAATPSAPAPAHDWASTGGSSPPANAGHTPALPEAGWWHEDAEQRERQRIVAALEATNGNQTKAAELLGISRRTLLHRLDQYGLPRPRKGRKRTKT